jgi:hypothetical protein
LAVVLLGVLLYLNLVAKISVGKIASIRFNSC